VKRSHRKQKKQKKMRAKKDLIEKKRNLIAQQGLNKELGQEDESKSDLWHNENQKRIDHAFFRAHLEKRLDWMIVHVVVVKGEVAHPEKREDWK
jgi:hypothetical protein